MILERATSQSVSDYMYKELISKLDLEFPSNWILDSKKHAFEKTESGLVMTAIDLAKFGSLYLKQGNWQGEHIISQEWVQESTSKQNVITSMEHFRYYKHHPWGKMWFRQNKAYYKYLWWGYKNREENNDYFALGNNSVAIRLGKSWEYWIGGLLFYTIY